MKPTKFQVYRKAIAAFVSSAVTLGGAVLTAQLFGGAVAQDIAKALVVLTPLSTLLGVAKAPANVTTPQPLTGPEFPTGSGAAKPPA